MKATTKNNKIKILSHFFLNSCLIGFFIIFTESFINVNTQSTDTNSCTNISSPVNATQCLVQSTSSTTCCFNLNQNENNSNECYEVLPSVSLIVNGTTIRKENGNFTQICTLSDSYNTIPTTCGLENPVNYEDCLITDSLSFLTNSYYCCYSKITVSGKSASSCIPTEITENMIYSYKNGGVDYKCMGTETFANSKIFEYNFLFIIFLVVIFELIS